MAESNFLNVVKTPCLDSFSPSNKHQKPVYFSGDKNLLQKISLHLNPTITDLHTGTASAGFEFEMTTKFDTSVLTKISFTIPPVDI